MNKIVLPLPPSANKYHKPNGFGGMYTTREAKDYKELVSYLANIPRDKIFTSNLGITLRVYRKRKSGDSDNFEKILFDALEGVLYKNDRQIKFHSTTVLDDKDNPRVEIRYWERNCYGA